MKTAISVIFGILTALVLAGGGYLGFAAWRDTRALRGEKNLLQTKVDSLNAEIAKRSLTEQTSNLAAELDSLKIALKASEDSLVQRLTSRGRVRAKPAIRDSLNGVYFFKLAVEGEKPAVDSFLVELKVPLIRFEKLEGVIRGKNLKLEVSGSVRFPR